MPQTVTASLHVNERNPFAYTKKLTSNEVKLFVSKLPFDCSALSFIIGATYLVFLLTLLFYTPNHKEAIAKRIGGKIERKAASLSLIVWHMWQTGWLLLGCGVLFDT